MNIAVLASGNGTNFEAIAKAARDKILKSGVKLLVTDVESAFVRTRAAKYNIPDLFINPRDFNSKQDFAGKILETLKSQNIDLVLLAGFMRLLPPCFIKEYRYRILNIHPSLLPAFKGKSAIKDAYNYGVKVTGVTVHFVDEALDNGPIILQESLRIDPQDTLDSLESKIHGLEHRLYIEAVRLMEGKKLKIGKRKVSLI
jgi:phosphoribosylglycinamide formyltransferase 1